MMIQNDFSRQANILNPEEFNRPIHIIGAGATGSWVAFTLAKMGLTNITVYDFDEVGMHNLPNQMFGLSDIDKNKALSIKNIIRRFTGFNIKARTQKVEGGQPLQGIVFMLTDTMKSRKDIYNMSIKNNPNVDLLIETRMDLRGGRIYAIDPKNRYMCKQYEGTFYSDDEAEVSACGVSQTVLPTALAITSHAIWKLLNYINGEPFSHETIIDLPNEIIFSQDLSDKPKLYQIKNKIIHCVSPKEANHLLDIARGQGFKWKSGGDLDETNWQTHREETCYHFTDDKTVMYGTIGTYKEIYPHQSVYKYDEIVK